MKQWTISSYKYKKKGILCVNNKYLSEEYWKNNIENISIENVKKYLNYINNLNNTNISNEYCEVHHIIPKSVKPELKKDEDNLITIKASDHFEIHKILKDCFIGEYKKKMEYAFNRMCYSKSRDKYNVTSEDYNKAKELNSKNFSGENNPTKRKDVQKKMSENHHDISGKNNPMNKRGGWSSEERKQISKSRIEKGVAAGENNPMYGKRGEENPNYGRVAIHKDGIGKRVLKNDLNNYLNDGWTIGALPKKTRAKKGYEWVSLNGEQHLVSKSEVQYYLNKGFKHGRNK